MLEHVVVIMHFPHLTGVMANKKSQNGCRSNEPLLVDVGITPYDLKKAYFLDESNLRH